MTAARPASLARIPDPAIRSVRIAVFVLALAPLARLVSGVPLDWLGANPIEFITRSTGTWTLVFIMLTLAVTPLRTLTGWNWVIRLRRMLGLFAFFYGVLHLLTYIWLDQFFDLEAILRDIVKRPFITLGFAAFVLMIPLAATSTNAMVRRLGGKRWVKLHRAIYALAILAVLHYWWLVKRDLTEPIIYAAVLALLLGFRLVGRPKRPPASGAPAKGGVAPP